MWFRVEVHKDGSVKSCDQVDGSLKNGLHVVYVEADSSEEAAVKAKSYVENIRARWLRAGEKRKARIAAGLCRLCGVPAPEGSLCSKHQRKQRAADQRRRDGTAVPRPKLTDMDRVARDRAHNAVHKKTRAERQRLYALQDALRAYTENPDGFIEWLNREIREAALAVENRRNKFLAQVSEWAAAQAAE